MATKLTVTGDPKRFVAQEAQLIISLDPINGPFSDPSKGNLPTH